MIMIYIHIQVTYSVVLYKNPLHYKVPNCHDGLNFTAD